MFAVTKYHQVHQTTLTAFSDMIDNLWTATCENVTIFYHNVVSKSLEGKLQNLAASEKGPPTLGIFCS